MPEAKIDKVKLSQMLRAGKAQRAIAQVFGVTESAVSKAKKELSITVVKNVALENTHRVVDKNLNAVDQHPQGRWQFKRRRPDFQDIGGTGKTVSHFHLAEEGWEDVPGGDQRLCYNEIATKQNWHYLKVGIDLGSMSFSSFQCNDRIFDVSAIEPMTMPAMANLWCMLNTLFWVETDRDKRAFLYVDSLVLSADKADK